VPANVHRRPFRHLLPSAVVATSFLLAYTVNPASGLLTAGPPMPERADELASTLRWLTVGGGQA
jgi:hypothetical protein